MCEFCKNKGFLNFKDKRIEVNISGIDKDGSKTGHKGMHWDLIYAINIYPCPKCRRGYYKIWKQRYEESVKALKRKEGKNKGSIDELLGEHTPGKYKNIY